MEEKQPQDENSKGVSKVKLAVGAASLFLFIIGVKRTFDTPERDTAPATDPSDRKVQPPAEPARSKASGRRRKWGRKA